ncbi:hypothetical protein LV779_24865 [Streptomyces thinghirensis]|nr:hypothetical protein [Streptomyces thinghirensis]
MLYDAHYGWQDLTRRQLAERAQLAGVRIDPLIELEYVEAAVKLAAVGVGDTIASRAVVSGPSFPSELHTASFAEPLYDTIALVRRRGRPSCRMPPGNWPGWPRTRCGSCARTWRCDRPAAQATGKPCGSLRTGPL